MRMQGYYIRQGPLATHECLRAYFKTAGQAMTAMAVAARMVHSNPPGLSPNNVRGGGSEYSASFAAAATPAAKNQIPVPATAAVSR